MKKVIASLVVACATLVMGSAKTEKWVIRQKEADGYVHVHDYAIHVDHAYLMKKHEDGSVYVIRVQENDGTYHDWYVTSTDKPWLFFGYEDGIRIIVDNTTDISTIR